MIKPDVTKIIKLFIVEDSDVQRALLIHTVNSCPDFDLIGFAKNGLDAIELIKYLKPDVVLMDLHMPKMNGVEAISHIMATNPVPIVAISANASMDEKVNSFRALEAGAVAFIEKPRNVLDPHYESLAADLIQTVKLMSEIKVIRRRPKFNTTEKIIPASLKNTTFPPIIINDIQAIAIGVSTGGPVVLQTILSLLPNDFPPLLIVQHIVPGFITGLAEWLAQATHCHITVANNNDVLERGHVYLAPDHHDMGITMDGHIFLKMNGKPHELSPSVDFLFNAMANVYKEKGMGILLTGMGNDGAKNLKVMHDVGAITIAQSKETSLIHGMPGQAIALGAATYILTPEEIAVTIASLSKGIL